MSDATAMGRTIREARLAQGMSLSQLAAAVGRSSSSVRRWERGEVPPAIGIIDDLATALDLDPDELRALRPSLEQAEEAQAGPPDEPELIDVAEVPVVSQGVDDQPTVESPAKPPSFFADVLEAFRSATRSWSSWIRGALTAGVLLVMAIVLIWAMGELFDALGRIWDSFDAGS